MNKHKKNLLIKSLETKYLFYQPKKEKQILNNFPYFSQWESVNLTSKFWSGEMDVTDDPNWKKSGAKTKLDYLNWSWSACGMACLKMVLAFKTKKTYPIIQLGEECVKYGGYIIHPKFYKKGDYLHSIDGLIYAPFLKYIHDKFKLDGQILFPMVIKQIVQALERGNIAMVSVNSYFKDPESTPPFKGGHLVLIVGYDWEKKLFYAHNPAGLYQKSQEYAEISFKDFNKFFDNKGMIINL